MGVENVSGPGGELWQPPSVEQMYGNEIYTPEAQAAHVECVTLLHQIDELKKETHPLEPCESGLADHRDANDALNEAWETAAARANETYWNQF